MLISLQYVNKTHTLSEKKGVIKMLKKYVEKK